MATICLFAFKKKNKKTRIPDFTFNESLELPGEANTTARQEWQVASSLGSGVTKAPAASPQPHSGAAPRVHPSRGSPTCLASP